MEYCQSNLGKELRQLKSNDNGPGMTAPKIMDLVMQMASASKYLAVKGVIHRDIKPENILINWKMLSPDGECHAQYKLADFGCVSKKRCQVSAWQSATLLSSCKL